MDSTAPLSQEGKVQSYGTTDQMVTDLEANHGGDGNGKGKGKQICLACGICCPIILFVLLNAFCYVFVAKPFVYVLEDSTRQKNNAYTPATALRRKALTEVSGICDTMIEGFRPTGESAESLNKKLGWKKVWLLSRKPMGDGMDIVKRVNMSAYYLPSTAPNSPTIIVQHGNNANALDHTVQTAAYYLRKVGYNVLLPNQRNHGDAENNEQVVVTWANEEVWDLLGAFDYVSEDPQGVLGGKTKQIAVMGFSMGGYVSKVAFGMEPGLRALLTDSAVQDTWELLKYFVAAAVGTSFPLAQIGWFWTQQITGHDLAKFSPETEMPANPNGREVGIIHGTDDFRVPFEQADLYTKFLAGLPSDKAFDVTQTWYGDVLKCSDDSSPHCKTVLEKCSPRHCMLHLTHQGKYCKFVCEFFGHAFQRSTEDCAALCNSEAAAEERFETQLSE